MNKIPFDKFQHLFYVAYAITIYKSQGSTFDFYKNSQGIKVEYNYTIHEFNHPMFNERSKYVSLSRITKIENIHINI